MRIKKSQIIYDLDKISARLEEMKNYSQTKPFHDQLCEVQRLIDILSGNVNGSSAGFTFSLTGREVLANPTGKCRFCGEPK